MCERAIPALKNDRVNTINSEILDMIPNDNRDFKSIDTTCDPEHAVEFPREFLNSLDPARFPPHILKLKVGAPTMILRNLDPTKLCNGTRMCINSLGTNVIEATIMNANAKGENVFIPRIP